MALARAYIQDISWSPSAPERNAASDIADTSTSSPKLMYRPPVVEWRSYAEAKIDAISKLSEDDWDDKGSPAISALTVKHALTVLYFLIKNVKLPKPNIVPGYNGEIIILWARNGYETRIWIREDGKFKYTEKTISSNKTVDFGWGPLATCLSLADLSLTKIF